MSAMRRSGGPTPGVLPRWRLLLSRAVWYGIPAVAVSLVLLYVGLAIAWHVRTPVVPVLGHSMQPTLVAGDVVLIHGVDPAKLRKGDIIAFHPPKAAQEKYNLPSTYTHRIIQVVGNARAGFQFRTRGDNENGPDPFWVLEQDVVGKEIGHVRYVGWPLLFFRSRQGLIFLGAVGLVAAIYFLLGIWERRTEVQQGHELTLATLVDEARALRDSMAGGTAAPRAPPPVPAIAPVGEPASGFDELVGEVRDANERSRETSEVMRELVGAIGEYGTHLRSHTEVMVQLAATTGELHKATAEMREAIASSSSAPRETVAPAADEVGQSEEEPPAPSPDAAPPVGLKRVLRGYSRDSVEAVIGRLSESLGAIQERLAELERHNAELRRTHEQVSAERDALRRQLAAYGELEHSAAAATVHAHDHAEQIKREAAEEARRILDAARDEASRLRGDSRTH